MTPDSTTGVKHDAAKPRASMVLGDFARALRAVAQVGTFGAIKYADHNWLTVPDGHVRYSDAMLRHWLAEHYDVDALDADSGLLHAAHVAWNALARLELWLRAAEGGV